jgi:tRNA dimethylallyltransferase
LTFPVILLVGPTASGKSAAALTLAERFNGEIVSIDSALVYRDMDIGTAKPTADELARVPHHLIDLIDPTERYSVARFVTDCLAAIADIQARGRLPLLVGGTMMYANILVNGMSDVPPADEAIRAGLAARRASEGIASLHAELSRVDPITAARLPPTDSQRIERALEVWHIAGVPLSSLQGQKKSALAEVPHAVLRWLPRDRAWLHARCEARLTTMFAQGFVAEVEALQRQYVLTPDLPSMRCVGYRQVLDALDGRTPKAEMMERALFATRQLAKRQITWLRGFAGQAINCDAADSVTLASLAIERAITQSAQVEA